MVENTENDGVHKRSTTDVVIVGAGAAGLYALYRLRKEGYACRVFDSADGVGGTWHWNRYPGCRVDVESVEYNYMFDPELDQEWEWSERYAAQPELLSYFNHVADRFDLRQDITLETRVESAVFDEESSSWDIRTDRGHAVRSRFLIMATGFLSAPSKPAFEGLEDFAGEVYHSGTWPREEVDFNGKRVAIIGTGSTAVQMTPIIAEQAAHLTVFQRTAPYIIPLRNCPMPAEYLDRVKANYDKWRAAQRQHPTGALALNFDIGAVETRLWNELTLEEREAGFNVRWENGGLALLLNTWPDLFVNPVANETVAEWVREKTRERIHDPELAEVMMPRDFPFGTKRLIADSGYYEAFARDNVELLDAKANPIERFSKRGLIAGGQEYEFDVVILATGFDAVTGAMLRVDIRGRRGLPVAEHWSTGPRTALGLMTAGFPNLFFLDGPGSPAPLYHPILLSELQTEWITNAFAHMRDRGASTIEPTDTLEHEYSEHLDEIANATLFPRANSWYMSANIPGKPRKCLMYLAGGLEYRRRINEAAAKCYSGFLFSHAGVKDAEREPAVAHA
ncbi:flavin-containing monooxygenase (plasmid) [Pseudonocardia bannensis]|uniref:NAD(P)/FAD-dependent oxidoreductase n=1 Tax=Pseudonocardia bannensis TaxID=630973 RepID=A0A848DIC8_9PSEU|nr:NAD(P)/FAD-dependent oxidoreductase [Pseudonocardia bannensis]NMH92448.1 NAD(P)/FAD-dependent oxidoreductase [Pseudonocardia bannensis]